MVQRLSHEICVLSEYTAFETSDHPQKRGRNLHFVYRGCTREMARAGRQCWELHFLRHGS